MRQNMWKITIPLTLVFWGMANTVHADFSEILEKTFRDAGLIAIACGVSDDVQTLEIAAFGMREINNTIPVSTADKWHLGSISKSLTTMLLGTYVAEGRLDLDANLPGLLPHLAADMHDDWRQTSLRDVLEHRAGLPVNFGFTTMRMVEIDTQNRRSARAKALRAVLSKPAKSREFRYSNIGYTLAGHVAETLGDQAWETQMRARIFIPMGLKTAGFGAPKGEGRYDQPVGHANFLGVFRKPMNPFDSPADNTPIIGPAGTVHMSIDDLLAYGRRLLVMSNGQDALLPAAVFSDITTPNHGQYAGGFIQAQADWAGGEYFWHNGSNTMWYALLVILPQKNRVIAITTNQITTKTPKLIWDTMVEIAAKTSMN
ncbi:MAG: serine hydrolase domain-containing protein [Paracoccaceae bacterium]